MVVSLLITCKKLYFPDSSPKISFGKMTISENGKEPCPYQFMYTMD
jgi:hypothetical protein